MSRGITTPSSSSLLRWMFAAVTAASFTAAMPLGVRAAQATDPAAGASRPDSSLTIGVGRSTLIKAPFQTKTVSIVDPKVADVQIISPTQVLVSGKGIGTTDLVMYNAEGQAEHIEIVVTTDRTALINELKRILPGSDIDIRPSRDAVIITGTLAKAEDVDRLAKYMEVMNVKYVDMTSIPGVQQVQIKVVIAEASRTAIRSLGINAFYDGNRINGGAQIGPDTGGALNPTDLIPGQPLNVSPATTLFGNFAHSDLIVFVQALAENQYLRVLAEPSLVALSGEEANFLAGGEFPIPVVQGAGASTNGTSISITYKKFGVQLKFRPTVTGEGTIRLHVAPEVSELTNVGSVQLQGFNIPGLLTRRAETTLELKSGQTFGMAGLISRSTQSRSSRIPALGDLPVIGAMFRSVRYQEGNTELLLLVTASLVEPMSVANRPPVPSEFHIAPNDWELYGLGRPESQMPSKISSTDAQWLRRSGLDKLRGPGAWATFETQGAVGTADVPAAAQGVGSGNTSVIAPIAAPSTLSKGTGGNPAATVVVPPKPAAERSMPPKPTTRPSARPAPAQ